MPNQIEITLIGNAGSDAKLITPTKAGAKPFFKFSLCVNTGTKDKPRTKWFNVMDYSKNPQSQYVKKGDCVFVQAGDIYASHWTNKENVTKDELNVPSFNVLLVDWHKMGAAPAAGEESQEPQGGDDAF